MEYHTINSALIVKPITEPISSEKATTIKLADESGGCFVVLSQSDGDFGEIRIDHTEWTHIRSAIDDMFMVGKDIDRLVGVNNDPADASV